jgi:hypothetical protein
LKKQTQFLKGRIGVSIYMKGYYEEFHALKAAKKQSQFKAKQSQFQTRRRFWCGRIEIATVAALLRNDISGLFEKTKPIWRMPKYL